MDPEFVRWVVEVLGVIEVLGVVEGLGVAASVGVLGLAVGVDGLLSSEERDEVES